MREEAACLGFADGGIFRPCHNLAPLHRLQAPLLAALATLTHILQIVDPVVHVYALVEFDTGQFALRLSRPTITNLV